MKIKLNTDQILVILSMCCGGLIVNLIYACMIPDELSTVCDVITIALTAVGLWVHVYMFRKNDVEDII